MLLRAPLGSVPGEELALRGSGRVLLGVGERLLRAEDGVTEESSEADERDTEADADDCGRANQRANKEVGWERYYSLQRIF
jgi:hypothetical protein